VTVASAGSHANLTLTHTSIPPLSFLQARCPSCCPTNSVKTLKVMINAERRKEMQKPGRWSCGVCVEVLVIIQYSEPLVRSGYTRWDVLQDIWL